MAIRKILEKGDPTLEKHCRPVTNFNERLHTLLDDMKETMVKGNGVGLAAPQVGVLRRAVVVLETNVEDEGEEFIIELINPEIIEQSGEQTGPEGCLSVPGEYGIVTRPDFVKVRAQNRNGDTFEYTGEGLTARCFCHEIDHLEGVLFTQRAERMLTPEELRGE
ncbi:MAG: peptide deformylase [Clostridiales bacterium]|nr:peptide deformylase [Clostridiales bacterium]